MTTLDDAWRWYTNTRSLLRLMGRMAKNYWSDLPWGGRLGNDDHFRTLEAPDIGGKAVFSLEHLDDLAVLVLFSVFESIIRDVVFSAVEEERFSLRHPALVAAADSALQGIKEGSFFRVLESYKPQDANLVEEVNQVRHYRNWVAHGRRGETPVNVSPKDAHARLTRFLDMMSRAEAPPAGPA